MAEAERAMPSDDGCAGLEALGHGDAEVMIRMSGCPNNCSRPRSAEIGIVGAGADRYELYTGGDYNGTRLMRTGGGEAARGRIARHYWPFARSVERGPAGRRAVWRLVAPRRR